MSIISYYALKQLYLKRKEIAMNAELIRLECVKIAAQTLSPNMDLNGLLASAEEIYNYIVTAKRNPNTVAD
jgi:hypothetical protein